MPETPFVETEALLLAILDLEDDSDHEQLREYLRKNFNPGELWMLKRACKRLSGVIEDLAWEM